jgi:tight adherence protein C
MENILWTSITIGVGILMVGLSYIFLNPVFQSPPGSRDFTLPWNSKRICSSFAGILITGILVLAATSSLEAALIAAAIPPFLWTMLFTLCLKHRKRRWAIIAKELPLLLDYLVLQVESGHSIQQALRSGSGLFLSGGPLHTGLLELDESMQVGCSIGQALEKFGQWLDTSEADVPIMAISQAIEHGTPLGKVLREQSKRMREYLILDGEQFANTVSVKILIPLLFFIFPASFLVIFSPVIVSLSVRLP